jgi:arylsulfatase A-like enzyme
MGDHSRPLNTFEEGMHIPLIFRHPGRIEAGSLFEGRTANYDLFPTLLDYLGAGDRVPAACPGSSCAGALTGGPASRDETIYYEYQNARLVRTDRWKYTWRHPNGPDDLYDMEADPGERNNLTKEPGHDGVIRDLRAMIEGWFSRHVDPQYDLWRGGRTKAGLLENLWTA